MDVENIVRGDLFIGCDVCQISASEIESALRTYPKATRIEIICVPLSTLPNTLSLENGPDAVDIRVKIFFPKGQEILLASRLIEDCSFLHDFRHW